MKMPSLFVSHGSPMFALEPGLSGPQLTALGRALPRPRAVLVLSPHWTTRSVALGSAAWPTTLHDFGGFAPALYAQSYPAPGAPEVALEVAAELARSGIEAELDDQRGRDHGAWVPLKHLYPEADVPVLQMSQPHTPSALALLELGQAVAGMAERGVLIVGSGSLTHNLREVGGGAQLTPYATEFADWIAAHIEQGDLGALLDYRRLAPGAQRAHPTDEHLLPLFFAIGAGGGEWLHARRIPGGVSHDVLSMDSYVFADPLGNLTTSLPLDAQGQKETS
jgi:4,5-DOPA dioxygenase extradiol